MTLEQAIAHAKEVAASKCDECGKEHAQLAAWLTKLQGYEDDTPLTEEFFERNGFYKDFREETEIEPSGEIWCYRTPEYHITAENICGDWVVQANGTVCIDTVGQLRMFLSLCGLTEFIEQLK